jgi:hypothetical protein
MTEPDRDLQELFSALRRHTASKTPWFDATVAAARRPTPPLRSPRAVRLVAAAAAAAAVVLLAVTWFGPRRPPAGIDLATTRWQAPTDFLLQTPGADLLRTVPALGSTTLERTFP